MHPRIIILAACLLATALVRAEMTPAAQAAALAAQDNVTAESESRLRQLVLELGRQDRSAENRQVIEQLAARPPQVFVRHEEGNAMVPHADVGAAARFVLREWDRRSAESVALRHARAGNRQLLEEYFSGSDLTRAATLDAVSATAAKDLVAFTREVEARIAEDGGALAAAFAQALADSRLYAEVVAHGDSGVALTAVNRLVHAFDAPTALTLLEPALQRSDIASAAMFAIGRLRPALAAADELTWRMLADPVLGSTAAAVLARGADRHTISRLQSIAEHTDDWWLRQRARLALQLADGSR